MKRRKSTFIESCYSCTHLLDAMKPEEGEPNYNTNTIRQKVEERYYCKAKEIFVDTGEVNAHNRRKNYIEEVIGERTLMNNPEEHQDTPFEDREYTSYNSYQSGYTYGRDVSKRVSKNWAYDGRKGCHDYKSMYVVEQEEAYAEKIAKDTAMVKEAIAKKKARLEANPPAKPTKLVWKDGKLTREEI